MSRKKYLSLPNEIYKYLFWGILFFIGWLFYRQKKMRIDNCPRYTIVKPKSISGGFSSFMTLDYDLIYKDKFYSGSDGNGLSKSTAIGNPKFYLNTRYLVRFNCEEPNNSEILWNITIPDTLISVPQNGWSQIPYNLDKIK
ncbi:hypothetical protein [Emticicia fontis]